MQMQAIEKADPWAGQVVAVGLAALIIALALEALTPPHLPCGGRRACAPHEANLSVVVRGGVENEAAVDRS